MSGDGITRYYDPRIGMVINATLDEAFTTGSYAFGFTNPFEVFGNIFDAPTWGYPEVYIPQPPEDDEDDESGWGWFQWLMLGLLILAVIVMFVVAAFTKGSSMKFLPLILKGGKALATSVAVSTKVVKKVTLGKVIGKMVIMGSLGGISGFVLGGLGDEDETWSWSGAVRGAGVGFITGMLAGFTLGMSEIIFAGMGGLKLIFNAGMNMGISAAMQSMVYGSICPVSVMTVGVVGGVFSAIGSIPVIQALSILDNFLKVISEITKGGLGFIP